MHIPCNGGAQQNQPTTLFSQFLGMLATGEKSDVQALELKRHLILPAGKHHALTPRSPAAPCGTGWRECPRDGIVGAVGRKERARLLTTAAVFRVVGRPCTQPDRWATAKRSRTIVQLTSSWQAVLLEAARRHHQLSPAADRASPPPPQRAGPSMPRRGT